MKELGMAIGTAAGSIFGSLMGNKMQQDQFGNQLTLMKKQHEYNEASANAAQARAYEMWEKTNYAAQIEQMKKAELSPALMYGQAAAFEAVISSPLTVAIKSRFIVSSVCISFSERLTDTSLIIRSGSFR